MDSAYDSIIVLQRPCSLPFQPSTPGFAEVNLKADSEEVHPLCKRLSHVKGGIPLKSEKVHNNFVTCIYNSNDIHSM